MAVWKQYQEFAAQCVERVARNLAARYPREDLDDLRQELTIDAWKAAEKADANKYPKAYINRAVINRGKMIIRVQQSQREVFQRRMAHLSGWDV